MLESDVIDRALDTLHATDLEYADGLANHGPMVVASLAEVGLEARIAPFLEAYLPRLRPLPVPDGSPAKLGIPATRRAWVDHYTALLEVREWRQVAREGLNDLPPGLMASGAHGWLRTAHAVQLLMVRETPSRRRELAFGLASWAARFQRLPGNPGSWPVSGLDVLAALVRVPVVDAEHRSGAGLLLDQVRVLDTFNGFADSVQSVDLEALPVVTAIGRLSDACAKLFLASPEAGRFAYLHALTAASAMRFVMDLLEPAAQRRLLGGVFQFAAAIHATNSGPVAGPVARHAPGRAILEQIEKSLDDHDLKFGVAALREDAIAPSRAIRAAAVTWMGLQTRRKAG